MLYFIRAREDRFICCSNIYYRNIFICHIITHYCTSSYLVRQKYLPFSPLLVCLRGFSKISVHKMFVKTHSHIAQGKEEMRDRCFCMVAGGMREAGEAALHPNHYSYFPFNHLTASHKFTLNTSNPLNLRNHALLKSQQGSQLSLEDIKDQHQNNLFQHKVRDFKTKAMFYHIEKMHSQRKSKGKVPFVLLSSINSFLEKFLSDRFSTSKTTLQSCGSMLQHVTFLPHTFSSAT